LVSRVRSSLSFVSWWSSSGSKPPPTRRARKHLPAAVPVSIGCSLAFQGRAAVLAETARAMALAAPEGLKHPRPRAALVGLRWRVAAFGDRSARRSRPGGNRGRVQDHHPPVQDRSGPRRDDRHRARRRHVPVKPVKAYRRHRRRPLFRPLAKGGRLGAQRLTARATFLSVRQRSSPPRVSGPAGLQQGRRRWVDAVEERF
jgi:hypothetical protein